METFGLSKKQEKEIIRLAKYYRRQAKKCYKSKSYFAGCVLIGAAMEALLLSVANCFPELIANAKSCPRKKNGHTIPLEKWSFHQLITIANELNWLPANLSFQHEWNTETAIIGDYVDLIRNIRNLIHPTVYVNEFYKGRITKKYLVNSFIILDRAFDYLSTIISRSLQIMLEERERRHEIQTS